MVEHLTENQGVPSSILGLGTRETAGGSSSVVECLLAKEEVAGSNPVFRSILFILEFSYIRRIRLFVFKIFFYFFVAN